MPRLTTLVPRTPMGFLLSCEQCQTTFEKNIELSQYKFALWNGLDSDDRILTDSEEITGVKYGIAIVRQEHDGVGFYNLGAKSSNPSIVNKYINEIGQYENFVSEFQEKTRQLFRIAKKFKFKVSSSLVKTKKLGHQFGNLYLTEREYECVNYLIRGKTAEEIAIILNISKRTAEAHVQNIKRKMNCYNQFRLGYLLGRLGIGMN